ncbi:GNAT family N-acetyltransferase [bacterium]|nr:GNAT family N-acetyltransferase [candidate division CSSED10-310 bacterium]
MNIRKLRKSERFDALRLNTSAFGNWPDDLRQEDIEWIVPSETIGVFVQRKLAAVLINLTLEQSVRGVIKNMAGVGGVATYPEHRMKGYVKQLMAAAFSDMHAKSQSVSMLAPFKESYYEMFDYVSANSNPLVKIPLQAFSHYLVKRDMKNWEEERVSFDKARNDFLKFLRNEVAVKHHGFVLIDSRSELVWKQLFKKWEFVFIKKNKQVVAVARIQKRGFGESGEFFVFDAFWSELEARDRLFNYLAKHRDQVSRVMFNLPLNENFFQWIRDTQTSFEIKLKAQPWMVRLIDVISAISDIPVSCGGSVVFSLEDAFCPWNNGSYRIRETGGILNIERCSKLTQNRFTIKGLSALVYGTLSMGEIIHRRWADAPDRNDRNILTQWFPVLPVYSTFYF